MMVNMASGCRPPLSALSSTLDGLEPLVLMSGTSAPVYMRLNGKIVLDNIQSNH